MLTELDKIDSRLERIEGKLDNYLERTTRVEEGLATVRGHIKLAITVAIATVSAILTAVFKRYL